MLYNIASLAVAILSLLANTVAAAVIPRQLQPNKDMKGIGLWTDTHQGGLQDWHPSINYNPAYNAKYVTAIPVKDDQISGDWKMVVYVKNNGKSSDPSSGPTTELLGAPWQLVDGTLYYNYFWSMALVKPAKSPYHDNLLNVVFPHPGHLPILAAGETNVTPVGYVADNSEKWNNDPAYAGRIPFFIMRPWLGDGLALGNWVVCGSPYKRTLNGENWDVLDVLFYDSNKYWWRPGSNCSSIWLVASKLK